MSGSLPLQAGLAALACGLWGLAALLLVGRRERAQVRLTLAALQHLSPTTGVEPEQGLLDRLLPPLVARLARTGRRLTPASAVERLRLRTELAGAHRSVEQVLGTKVLAAAGLGLAALALWPGAPAGAPLAAAAGAAAGFWLPDLLLTNSAQKRQAVLQRTLPDALDLLTICVGAGLGFDAALTQAARSGDGPLQDELRRVLQEMQIGESRSDALRGLAARTDVEDLHRFVSAVVQADRLGVPLAGVLREQAKEMRLKRSQRAEEQAHKVPVKILFPMVVFLLPTIFVIIIGPGAITLAKTL